MPHCRLDVFGADSCERRQRLGGKEGVIHRAGILPGAM
jgi:hypothetical protein